MARDRPDLGRRGASRRGEGHAARPAPSGTGFAGYQVADYLDQHDGRTRQDQLSPLSLWDALTTRVTSALDLTHPLGQAARIVACTAMWTAAAALGSANAAWRLIDHLREVSPSDTMRAAQWTAGQVSLDDPGASVPCWGRYARPGPATRSVPWPTGPPPRPAR
jgi:hypothetical protein